VKNSPSVTNPAILLLAALSLGLTSPIRGSQAQEQSPEAAAAAQRAQDAREAEMARARATYEQNEGARIAEERYKKNQKPPAGLTREEMEAQQQARQRLRLRLAFQEFYAGMEQLNTAVTAGPQRKYPGNKIQKSAKLFLNAVESANRGRQHPRFDSSDFKGASNAQLALEALMTAARITPGLVEVVNGNVQKVFDVRGNAPLLQLELELRKLQWMAGQLD
jgi:hypothetical protein